VINGGAALVIDYGHAESGAGETLQAVAKHAFADPLKSAGEADLTAHVDFQALAATAESSGARVHGPVGQGACLRRLGIEQRADALKRSPRCETPAEIGAALARLTGTGKNEMGGLFKVMAFADPGLGELPGFA
jgi:NADH dehydrogenase [ubiquinone] 1 alpha subcomplex assembly factor 7